MTINEHSICVQSVITMCMAVLTAAHCLVNRTNRFKLLAIEVTVGAYTVPAPPHMWVYRVRLEFPIQVQFPENYLHIPRAVNPIYLAYDFAAVTLPNEVSAAIVRADWYPHLGKY